jgi:hypothetical protein
MRPRRTPATPARRRQIVLAAMLLTWLHPLPAAAQQDTLLARGNRTRLVAGGWGHSWRHGWPGYGKARSDIAFVGFYPQLGWFVTSQLELYGEATVHAYYRPDRDVFAGLAGAAGRYYFSNNRSWTPYVLLAGGFGWTSLDVVEIDRVANFQVSWGAGVRQITRKGPGWILEFRNHHISNAGTSGENIGVNTATFVAGVHWVIRDRGLRAR